MSMTKLTLSADEHIIALAKKQARQDGLSLSAMFSSFIRARSRQKKSKLVIGPLTRQALEIGQKYSNKKSIQADDELVEEALAEKYGLEL